MSDVKLFAWIVMGVVISVVLPIFVKWLKEVSDQQSKGTGDVVKKVWTFTKPYLKVALASAGIGFVALIIYRAGFGGDNAIDSWAKAVIYGYTWDSTFQKVFTAK